MKGDDLLFLQDFIYNCIIVTTHPTKYQVMRETGLYVSLIWSQLNENCEI